MWYRLGADALLFLHSIWIGFLILGLPAGVYFRLSRLRLLHAMGLLLALVFQLTNSLCPLTIWEEQLRIKTQPGFTYRGSFLITNLEKLVYPDWISMNAVTILTALLVALTLISFFIRPLSLTHH